MSLHPRPPARGEPPKAEGAYYAAAFAAPGHGAQSKRRPRKVVWKTIAGVPLIAAGLAAPGLERLAAAQLAEGLSSRSGEISVRAHGVDVLVDGLAFEKVTVTGPGVDLVAGTVRVIASTSGLHVSVDDLEGRAAPRSAAEPRGGGDDANLAPPRRDVSSLDGGTAAQGAPAGANDPQREGSPPSALAPDALDRLLARVSGVPVHFEARGSLQLGSETRALTLADPQVELSPRGDIDVRGRLLLRASDLPSLALESLHAHTRAAVTPSTPWRSVGWSVTGTLQAPNPSPESRSAAATPAAPALGLRAELDGDRIVVQLATHDGGQAALSTRRPNAAGDPWVVIAKLDAFPLAVARPWLAKSAWAPHVSLQDTTLSGTIGVTRRAADDVSVALDAVTLMGVVVDHPRVAREPLGFDAIDLDGDLHRGETLSGQLAVGHRGAELVFGGTLGEDRIELSVELAPMPCQRVLEAMPDGLLPSLQGTTLAGTFDARVEVAVTPSTLIDFHPGFFDDPTPPGGKLDVRLPFFEQCTLVHEPTAVDAAAIAGPYRHRFLSDGGREIERVLAPGGEGFFSLSSRPDVGMVFVALEDMNFFDHHGFDEQQIERAFWHNLSAGRIERGASTISQQTARNLWLGVDRSLSRKLQEALLTARLEAAVDKRRILEVYVNIIELGPEVHGVAEAARFHFERDVSELNLLELVHLASMAPAPVTYSKRFASGEVDAEWRAKLEGHVARMARLGLIDAATAAAAKRAPLRLARRG